MQERQRQEARAGDQRTQSVARLTHQAYPIEATVSYDDFRKVVLYAVARNGGSLYQDSLPPRVTELDPIDFYLHLRQMQDEELVDRKWSRGVPKALEAIFGAEERSKPYLELQPSGWEWVRKDRALDTAESTRNDPAAS